MPTSTALTGTSAPPRAACQCWFSLLPRASYQGEGPHTRPHSVLCQTGKVKATCSPGSEQIQDRGSHLGAQVCGIRWRRAERESPGGEGSRQRVVARHGRAVAGAPLLSLGAGAGQGSHQCNLSRPPSRTSLESRRPRAPQTESPRTCRGQRRGVPKDEGKWRRR